MLIKGTGFVQGATVTFGGVAATSVVVVDAFTITCLTPAHAVGLVDVVVTNPDTQSATRTDGYRYSTTFSDGIPEVLTESEPDPPAPEDELVDSPAPTVRRVVLDEGTTEGGTRVLVLGDNFHFGATVLFGGVSAGLVVYVNGNSIVCTTPPHTAVGSVDVKVTNPDTQFGTLTNGYTYIHPAAEVISIDPDEGTTAGGDLLTITGRNFFTPVIVVIGGLTGISPTVVNSQTVTVTTPHHTRGLAEVSVFNTD